MSDSRLCSEFQNVIFTFFKVLKAESIPCFIARGGKKLPLRLDGNDIDIFVRTGDLARAEHLLIKAAASQGLVLIHRHKRAYFSAFWFQEPQSSDARFIHIDLYPGAFTWKGLRYLSDEEALQDIHYINGLPFPYPKVEVLSLLMPSFLWGGFVKEKYLPTIQALLANPETRKSIADIFQRNFGKDEGFLCSITAGACAPRDILQQVKRYRFGLLARSLGIRLFSTARDVVSYLQGEFHSWIRPPGLVVSILGADGAGKSLLLRNLEESVGGYFGATQVYHWRPSVLPDIGVLLKQRSQVISDVVSDPHSKPPHGFFSSFFRICYYLCDYHLGWALRVWPAIARNHVIFFDRYADDMAVDPRRYRLGLPNWLLALLCFLAPRPDLTLVLTAPSDILLSRKQEVSRDELEKTLKRLAALTRDSHCCQEIDCTPHANIVAGIASKAILQHLRDRRS